MPARNYNFDYSLIYSWLQCGTWRALKRISLKVIKEQNHFGVKESFVQIAQQLDIVGQWWKNNVNNGDEQIPPFIFRQITWTWNISSWNSLSEDLKKHKFCGGIVKGLLPNHHRCKLSASFPTDVISRDLENIFKKFRFDQIGIRRRGESLAFNGYRRWVIRFLSTRPIIKKQFL